ncbi:MAG: hypothetical protein WBH28_17525, partial [Fuerstiella sp.]
DLVKDPEATRIFNKIHYSPGTSENKVGNGSWTRQSSVKHLGPKVWRLRLTRNVTAPDHEPKKHRRQPLSESSISHASSVLCCDGLAPVTKNSVARKCLQQDAAETHSSDLHT